jgi:hypothetical protein
VHHMEVTTQKAREKQARAYPATAKAS